jgi:low temperature requirement protein LtrA
MQVGPHVFVLVAVRHAPGRLQNNFSASPSGSRSPAPAGSSAVSRSRWRLAWWTLALGIELVGPWALVSGSGARPDPRYTDWNVDGGHMAERCALFVIIALGESLLVTGATFAELTWDAPTLIAFFSAVLGSILMWWLYFDTAPSVLAPHRARRRPGPNGALAYTYVHIVIVAESSSAR